MFEVKRKPDESQSTRGVTATAAARARAHPTIPVNNPALKRSSSSAVINPADDVPTLVPLPKEGQSLRTRMPVITGEAHYKGTMPIDGVLMGQLGGNGGSLVVRQKSMSMYASQPELSGEITFRDMLRVNGHIAGSVHSKGGTLFIDASARVDANIEVGTVIVSGTVVGDIVAERRVEVGATARIYGNIWTRCLSIKDGAVFDGVCTMIEEGAS